MSLIDGTRARAYDDGRWVPKPYLYQTGVFSDGEPVFTYILGNIEYDGTIEMIVEFCTRAELTVPVPMMIIGVN